MEGAARSVDFLIDTSFLIDLWREQRKPGPATRFAREHADKTAGLSWMAMGEFLRGSYAAGLSREDADAFLDAYLTIWPSRQTVEHYARLFVKLRKVNKLIGPNDLWIASTALEHGLPIVTRNHAEFSVVEGLVVWRYA